MTTDELIKKTIKWGKKHKIDNPYRQLNKVVEELGELSREICRDRFDSPELKDAVGDVLVAMIVLSDICGHDPVECLKNAYNEIADRKGVTSDGVFIKNPG